ncbi:hypothetical protein Syun_013593 [Stephania yunnanensis]|uniref:Uncharacterized protein n=1 Tax=Stephania yunnanensis TaxID=152371 RepID=A0AAP0JHP5_9MAGN
MPTVQASAAASAGRRPHQPRRLPPTSRIVAAPLLAGPAAAPRRSSLSHRHPSLSAISLSLSLFVSLSRGGRISLSARSGRSTRSGRERRPNLIGPLLAGPAAAPRRSSLSHRRPSLSAISLSVSLSLAAVGSLFRPDPVARPDLAERGDRIRRRVCWPPRLLVGSPTAEQRRRRATPGRTCRCAGDHGSGGGHHI